MRVRHRLLASAGVFILSGAALAQTAAPDSNLSLDPLRSLTMPRLTPNVPQNSPEATACANADGKVSTQARAEACGKLINSGNWKGQEIAWAYSNRCFALKKLGQSDKALVDCDKAIELDGKNAVAYQVRGMIFQDKGAPERALADYDKAVDAGGKNAALFSDRGNLLLAAGEADKALADYDSALELNAGSATTYVERGGAYLAKGQLERAKADYAKAVELAPNNAFAIFNRGVAFYAAGEKTKAAEQFRQALKVDPKGAYPGLWLFLALGGAEGKAELQRYATKFAQGAWPAPVVKYDLGAADAAATLAAAKAPGDQCEAQFYIGAERLAKGAKDEGVDHLRKAADGCPKNFIEYIQAVALLKAAGVQLPVVEAKPELKRETTPEASPEPVQEKAAAPNSEAPNPEPAASEPAKSDPAKSEPANPDATQTEAAKPEAAEAPKASGGDAVEPSKTEPSAAEEKK